jgi:uncharacterized membrane protein
LNNGKAITSLVLGILSLATIIFTGLGIILGFIGMVLGIIGIKEISRLKQEGRKMAVTGIILSSLGIVLPIFLMVISYMTYSNPVSS